MTKLKWHFSQSHAKHKLVDWITGSPSSKYEPRRTSALLCNIRNIRICIWRIPIVSVTYENERISIKTAYRTENVCYISPVWSTGQVKLLTLGVGDSLLLPLTSIPNKDNDGSKRLSPTPSVSNLSLRPCRYLSTVTRNSSQGSVDGFSRERLQRFATFDSLSVERRLEAR